MSNGFVEDGCTREIGDQLRRASKALASRSNRLTSGHAMIGSALRDERKWMDLDSC